MMIADQKLQEEVEYSVVCVFNIETTRRKRVTG